MEEKIDVAQKEVQGTASEALKEEKVIDDGAETTLTVIANILLVFGIIATLICAFTIMFVNNPEYHYIERKEFNPSGFATTVMVLFSSLISWGVMRVIANISLTLKDINRKMK